MHRDLVARRKWITDGEYKEGLTLAQIMPGPLAAQLAIYLGYVHYGVLGATLVVQQVQVEPVAPGLDAICEGIRLVCQNDETALERGAMVYDALYARLATAPEPVVP